MSRTRILVSSIAAFLLPAAQGLAQEPTFGGLRLIDGLTEWEHIRIQHHDVLRTVFLNGELVVKETLAEIRARVKG